MNNIAQYNQQTEPKQHKSEVEEICIYQNLESGCHQHLYLKINSEIHARKNPKQQYLKVVTFSDALFSKKHMFTTMQPSHSTLNRPSLISNLPTVCIKLTRVGGWF